MLLQCDAWEAGPSIFVSLRVVEAIGRLIDSSSILGSLFQTGSFAWSRLNSCA